MTVTELVVKINADLSGFNKGFSKIENKLRDVGQSMQGLGMKITAGITLPIALAGGALIKAAADAEEMQGMFDTVFSKVGGKVTNDLAKFGKEVGRSRFELMGMAAQFGDTLKPIGFTEEAAGDLSVQLTKLATDLGSFKNMPMEEALQRLQGTLIGSHENALKFGVIINENVLKQELFRMGADKLTGSQREQAKVQARINLLMAGTTDAQGDALRTSESFTNQLRGLKATLSEIAVEMGNHLLPFATELVVKLRSLANWFGTLSPETVRMGLAFAGVVAAIGPAIFVMGSLASSLASVFRFVGLLSGLMSPWIFVIGGVAAAAIYLWKNWEQVSASIKDVYDAVKDKFKPALEEIVKLVDGVMDIGAAIFGTLLTWWTDNKGAVLSSIGTMWDNISSAFAIAAEAVGVVLNVGLGMMQDNWDNYGKAVVTTVGLGLQEVLNMTGNIMGIMGGLIQLALDVSGRDWEGAWISIKGIVATQTAATQTTIENFAKAVPAILGGDDGKGVASGDSVGAEDMKEKLAAALEAGKGKFSEFADSILGSLGGPGGASDSLDDFKDSASDAFGSTGIASYVDSLGVSIKGLKTVIGENLGDTSDIEGVETAFSNLKEGVDLALGELGAGATVAEFKAELAKRDVFTSLTELEGAFGTLSIGLGSKLTESTGFLNDFKAELAKQDAFTSITNLEGGFLGLQTAIDTALGSIGAGATIDDFKAELAKQDVFASLIGIEGGFDSLNTAVDVAVGQDGAKGDVEKFKGALDDLGSINTLDALTGVATNLDNVKDSATSKNVIEDLVKLNTLFFGMSLAAGSIPKPVNEAKTSLEKLFETVPDTLPEIKFDVKAPDPVVVSAWTTFFRGATDFFKDLGDTTGTISGHLRNIGDALKVLGLDSKFTNDVVNLATDIHTVVEGFESLVALLDVAFWKNVVDTFIKLGTAVGGVVTSIFGTGGNAAPTGPTGAPTGPPDLNNPGGGTDTTGGLPPLPDLPQGNLLGNSIAAAVIAAVGIPTLIKWLEGGKNWTEEELQAIRDMPKPGFVTGGLNLDGLTGIDLAGLQGFMGGGGQANGGSSQNITTNLDGRMIARVIMPYIVEELSINGTTV